eukprot:9681658-Alexandrium_andersonii.AAC.1
MDIASRQRRELARQQVASVVAGMTVGMVIDDDHKHRSPRRLLSGATAGSRSARTPGTRISSPTSSCPT